MNMLSFRTLTSKSLQMMLLLYFYFVDPYYTVLLYYEAVTLTFTRKRQRAMLDNKSLQIVDQMG
jgi:hypothetical protein